MKKILHSLVIIISVLSIQTFNSCSEGGERVLPPSQGALYEIFAISSQAKWDGELGDTLKQILQAPIPMLNQVEPHFDLMRVNPNGYKHLIPRHRNQLIVNTGKKYTEPSIEVRYNVFAEPQVIVTVAGPNDSILTNYVWQNRKELLQVFMMSERDNAIESNKKHFVKGVRNEVKKKFDIILKVPQGCDIRMEEKDFMWLTIEYPLNSIGMFIYEYPYTGEEDFKLKNLVAQRNKFSALIQSQKEGSHMITAEIDPLIAYKKINGVPWIELRGFWEVTKDFMGGPFVSYSHLNKTTQKIICIDFYVYAPQKDKRNFMRHLENLIYTVELPDAKQETSEDKTTK